MERFESSARQCVELDGFFNGQQRDPLEGSGRNMAARLEVLRETREAALGPWHRRMLRLIEDILQPDADGDQRRASGPHSK